MISIKKVDEVYAGKFYDNRDALSLIAKYENELDSELMDDPTKLAIYIMAREGGADPVFANMRACRRAPGAANCDRHFNEQARRRMNGMGRNAQHITALARGAGINTAGKFYVGGLGKYTDKQAWVSTADDILTVAKERNLTVRGAVNHEGHEVAPPVRKGMANDIVNEYARKYIREDPATAERIKKSPKRLAELKEKIVDKHSRRTGNG